MKRKSSSSPALSRHFTSSPRCWAKHLNGGRYIWQESLVGSEPYRLLYWAGERSFSFLLTVSFLSPRAFACPPALSYVEMVSKIRKHQSRRTAECLHAKTHRAHEFRWHQLYIYLLFGRYLKRYVWYQKLLMVSNNLMSISSSTVTPYRGVKKKVQFKMFAPW